MGIMMTMMPMMIMIMKMILVTNLPIHMGRSMVGEHAPIRDPCLVDAVQVDAVLADDLENMTSSMMMM